MLKYKFKAIYILSAIIAVIALFTSLGGLFIQNVYRDNKLVTSVLHGNDLVTLVIAVPLMAVSLVLTVRGSNRARLVWIGTLVYMMYNYLFYLYGAAFNRFFLLYVALFTLSVYTIVFAFMNTEIYDIARLFNKRVPVKLVSGFMVFFAALLGGLWIAMSLSYIFSGNIPETVIDTGHQTAVVFATDLSVLIPAMAFGAILLWKRKAWGYVLSAVMLVKATTYGIGLIVMGLLTYYDIGIWDSMFPLWAFLTIGCLISAFLLLGNMKAEKIEDTRI